MAWMACNAKMDPETGPRGSNSRVSYGVTPFSAASGSGCSSRAGFTSTVSTTMRSRRGRPAHARLDGAGEGDAGGLLVIAKDGLEDDVPPAQPPRRLRPHDEARRGVDPDGARGARLRRHLQPVGEAARQRLLADDLHGVALGLPVDERALEVGLLGERGGLLGRQRLRLEAAVERGHAPAGRAVPGPDARRPLELELRADAAGSSDLAPHDRLPAGPGGGAARHADRPHRREGLSPAACRHVAGHDLVHGLRRHGRRREKGHGGEDDPCVHGAHLGTGCGRGAGRGGFGLTTGPVGQ